jgi:3-oxoacyl-[acyl-carrier protein] reductase
MDLGLKDRTAVVTGASRGLGRAMALGLAGEGAYVYVGFQRREEGARETLGQIEAAGGAGEVLGLDVRDAEGVDVAFGAVIEARGQLDVLVNNAGLSRDNLFPLMKTDEWDEVLDVNLTGLMRCCRAATRPMIRQRQGAIVNLASVAGVHASPGQANYAASKGGVIAFTRTLAAELAPRGIRVNAVVPGLFAAGMAVKLDHRVIEARRDRIPLKRMGEAGELARVVCFLASEASSYIIGQAIVVDGGMTL